MRSLALAAFVVVALTWACSNQPPPPAAAPPADGAAVPKAAPAPPPPPDAKALSSFKIEASLDMALAREEGDAMTFTSGGKLPPKPPELAIFRASRGPAVPQAERAKKAKELLASTDLATQVKPGPQKPVKVGELAGFQLEGRGQADGAEVSLYGVVVFAPDATFTMVGRSSTERFAWYRPTFEKMVQTFQRR